MSPTLKKILLLLMVLLVAGAIGFGLYLMFIKTGALPSPKPTIKKVTTPTGELPAAGERAAIPGGQVTPGAGQLPSAQVIPGTTPSPSYFQPAPVTKITSDFVVYPSLDSGGNTRYHNAADGKFYQLTPDGQIKALSDQTFYNVSKVTWAANQNKAVIEYPDSSKIIYNFDTKKQVTLPKHWNEFSFDSDEIGRASCRERV